MNCKVLSILSRNIYENYFYFYKKRNSIILIFIVLPNINHRKTNIEKPNTSPQHHHRQNLLHQNGKYRHLVEFWIELIETSTLPLN